jgi:hypothetical protein
MKMPKMSSQQSLNQTIYLYSGAHNQSIKDDHIAMMVDVGCLEGCVGATGSTCSIKCGVDRQCWIGCAGAPAISCIDDCFATAAAIARG